MHTTILLDMLKREYYVKRFDGVTLDIANSACVLFYALKRNITIFLLCPPRRLAPVVFISDDFALESKADCFAYWRKNQTSMVHLER